MNLFRSWLFFLFIVAWVLFVSWYTYKTNSTFKSLYKYDAELRRVLDKVMEEDMNISRLSESSKLRLETCDAKLQLIICKIAEGYEVNVEYGYLSDDKQKELYEKGRTKLKYIKEHSCLPAKAVRFSSGSCYNNEFISQKFENVAEFYNIEVERLDVGHFKLKR